MKRLISLLAALAAILTLASALPISAASVTISETVDIASARANMRGHGYEWDNINKILTLDGINVETKSDFGLRLPSGSTVVLKGKNCIKAGLHGVSCSGNVVFKGSGSLEIDAGKYGIYLISQDNTTKVRVLDGTYTISAGECGIYSDYTDFSLSGGRIDVSVESADGTAVSGRVVNLVCGSFSADSPVTASHSLTVDSIDINVSADSPALDAKNLTVRNVSIAGADGYNGENSISATALTRWHAKSTLFGNDAPGWLDTAALLCVAACVSACVAIPVILRKKKKKKLYASLAAEGYLTEAEAEKRAKE